MVEGLGLQSYTWYIVSSFFLEKQLDKNMENLDGSWCCTGVKGMAVDIFVSLGCRVFQADLKQDIGKYLQYPTALGCTCLRGTSYG